MWTWRWGSGAAWPRTGRAAEWRLKRPPAWPPSARPPGRPAGPAGAARRRWQAGGGRALEVTRAARRSCRSSAAAAAANSTETDFGRRVHDVPVRDPQVPGALDIIWSPVTGCSPAPRAGDLLGGGALGEPQLSEQRSGGDRDGGALGHLHVRSQLVALAGVVRLPLAGVLLVVRVVVGLRRQHHFLGPEHRRTPNYLPE